MPMKRWLCILTMLAAVQITLGQASRDFLPPYNFQVDSTTLLATWEAPKIVLLNEDFDGELFPPPGWADTTLGLGWLCEDDPQYHSWWIVPEHTGKIALVNDDWLPNNNGSMDFLYTPELDLTVADSFMLYFDSYYDGAYGQTAYVKYSLDNGESWQLLKQMEPSLQWQKVEIDLTAFSGSDGVSNFKLTFYSNDQPDNLGWWGSGWAVDNVTVNSDDIPNQFVSYEVLLNSTPVDTVNTTNYQYYFEYNSLFSSGITALYTDGVSDTIWQVVRSYYLPEPEELTASYFTYYPPYHANLKWYPPMGYQQEPPIETATLQGQDQEVSTGNRDVGDVLMSFTAPYPINSCQGICDDGWNLWITDPNLSPTMIYQVNFSGEHTGVEITVNQGQSWIGGMASYNNVLYAILVGGPNAIVKIDLETGETLETITGDWSVIPQQALTADFKNQEFYIGGWDGDMIWRTDFNGVTISTHIFADVSGLAWDQYGGAYSEGSLWVVAYSSSSFVSELAPNNDWVIYQSFQFPGGQPYSGAGAAISRLCAERGNLWLCDKINNMILLVDLSKPWDLNDREYLPENLIGYNVYRNGGFRFFTSCTDPCWCNHSDYPNLKDSSFFKYEVSALFDLSPYGFPGDTGESLKSEPAVLNLSFFNELDFFEDWAPGSPNYWELNVNSWKIDPGYGNNSPAAVFKTNQVLYQYEQSLETWQIVSDGMPGDIILEYDVSLSSFNPSGYEKLLTEVYDYVNNTWNTIKTCTNLDGNFDWRKDTLDITTFLNDNHFKIRFNAKGENSDDIEYWAVDNITIRRECYPPDNVRANLKPPSQDSVLVSWDEPVPPIEEWKQWDDGVPYNGIGFGTSKDSWFDFAIRWTPELLVDLKGASITAVGFIPGDVSACFKISLWSGDDFLPFYTQATGNLNANQWSIFQLDTPQKVDITRDLYAGYRLSTYCDYPVSVDNGPAIDHLGNMFRYESGGPWSTLLEANPDFNWNLNIKAYFERDGVPVETFQLFRSINGNEPELLAEVDGNEYADTTLTGYYSACYKLKSSFFNGCISGFSEDTCVVITGINPDNPGDFFELKIYPNPASDVLFIESSERMQSISFYDSQGDKVIRWYGDKGKVEVQVDGLAPGIYMVRVETSGEVLNRKIIVIK
jgi:hypothetical protein